MWHSEKDERGGGGGPANSSLPSRAKGGKIGEKKGGGGRKYLSLSPPSEPQPGRGEGWERGRRGFSLKQPQKRSDE